MTKAPNRQVRVSIIIAVYNAGIYLDKTLEALLFQNFYSFEVIIVDNNSLDETSIVVSKYSKIVSKYIREEDSGIYDAWNKGISYARGEWISFLGAGDLLYNDALSKLINLLDSNCEANFVSGCVKFVDSNSNSLIVGSKFCPNTINYYQNVAHIASLMSKKMIVQNNFFSTNYRISGDYDFFLRAKNDIVPLFLNDVICTGSFGISQTNSLVFIENFKIWQSLNIHNFLFRYILLVNRLILFYLKRIL
jgi:glycosyltransferase involved in cell wall biosynthesis